MDEIALPTRQHRSGNSLSVRLPGVAAYADPNQPLNVIVRGDERILRPRRAPEPKSEPAPWPKPTITAEEYFAWQDANAPLQIGEKASMRAVGRPNPWRPYARLHAGYRRRALRDRTPSRNA